MGAVWRANHERLDAPIALKFIDCHGPRREQLSDRFLREAKVCAAVRHRNVVQIMDFGEYDEGPYMVMELLEGRTLADEFRKKKPMPIERVFAIVGQCLAGLAAVHERGIVHRDLKPQNIFLVKDADTHYPKLLDFGVSRALDSDGPQSALTTSEGVMAGTPNYMAPEQARGMADIDERSDVYSMGVIMFRAITARHPYRAPNVGDLLIMKVTQDAPRMNSIMPELGREICDFVAKALQRDRGDRFKDAREMLDELRLLALDMGELAETSVIHEVNLARLSIPPSSIPAISVSSSPPDGVATVAVGRPSPGLAEQLEPEDEDGDTSPEATTPGSWESDSAETTSAFNPMIVAGAAAALAAAVGLAIALGGGEEPAPATATPPDPAQTAAPVVAPQPMPPSTPVAAEPTTAKVTLMGLPEGARVSVDNEPQAGTQFELPRSMENRRIEVTADGYAPMMIMHAVNADTVIPVVLTMLADEPAPQPRARPTTPRAPRVRKPVTEPAPKPKKPARIVEELDF